MNPETLTPPQEIMQPAQEEKPKDQEDGEQPTTTEKAETPNDEPLEKTATSYTAAKETLRAMLETIRSPTLLRQIDNATANLEKAQASQRTAIEKAVVDRTVHVAKEEGVTGTQIEKMSKQLEQMVQLYEKELQAKTASGRLNRMRAERAALIAQDATATDERIKNLRKKIAA